MVNCMVCVTEEQKEWLSGQSRNFNFSKFVRDKLDEYRLIVYGYVPPEIVVEDVDISEKEVGYKYEYEKING